MPTAKKTREPSAEDRERGPVLELAGCTRSFGALTAVRQLDIRLEPGRIHAIIGENGAGKSTAFKLLAGMLAPSEGRVLVDGERLDPATAREAFRRGIGLVHQHFMLVESFSALENLVLGSEPTDAAWGRLDLAKARARGERLGRDAGLDVPLDTVTSELSVGERQRLEILRVLFRGARAILLDEPTAVLSPVEVGELYATLRMLADGGRTLAVVTHRLDEVVRYCDHVTVLRRGERVLDEPIGKQADVERLTRAIMGGEPPPAVAPPELRSGRAVLLRVHDLSVRRSDGALALDRLALELRAGEVLGIAGVEGNGQRELARALAGLERLVDGVVEVDGVPLFDSDDPHREPTAAVRRARAHGLVAVHEDRHRDELLLDAAVSDNLVLGDLGRAGDEATRVQARFRRFAVYPPDPARLAGELSGGNQQKLVLARALDRRIRVLVLAQPTRGVDVGTARTIQRAVADAAAAGAAVVVISADLGELRSLSHAIAVLRRGKLVARFEPSASDEAIGRAMLGHDVEAAT